MVTRNLCDGCGESAKLEAIGWSQQREYCPACLAIARAFLKEIDDVHDLAVKTFRDGVERVTEKYRERLDALPDD